MLTYFIALLLLATMGVSLYSLHKIRRVHVLLLSNNGRIESEKLFRQLEALQALHLDLMLPKSLPPTRGWAASPDFLREIAQYALRAKPTTVVECSSGVSTIVLARCMQLNGGGKVYSLENDAAFAQKTRDNLCQHGLSDWAVVLDAPLRPHMLGGETWPWYAEETLPQNLDIDMFVIDGPPASLRPMARYPAGPILFPCLAGNAAVFLDDAGREDEQRLLKRWRVEFPTFEFGSADCEKGCAVLKRTASAGVAVAA
jgi:hypothetical protein